MNERNLEINRANQALLNKLVEISTGKFSCVPPLPAIPHNPLSSISFVHPMSVKNSAANNNREGDRMW